MSLVDDEDVPRVFVGLPVYNGEKYLRAAIESVLNQDFENFQLVISDNHSTDGTQLICDEYVAQDPRVKCIRHEQNLGALGNFSYLKDVAIGDYFSWIASDDLWTRNRLSEMVAVLDSREDIMGCGSDVECIDELGNICEHWTLDYIYDEVDWTVARRSFFRTPPTRAYLSIYGLFRTKFIQEFELPSPLTSRRLASGTDQIFVASLASRGRIVALPLPLMKYRRHFNSVHRHEARVADRWIQLKLEVARAKQVLAIVNNMPASRRERMDLAGEVLAGFVPHRRLLAYLQRRAQQHLP